MNEYIFESPLDGSATLLAPDDMTAAVKARAWLRERKLNPVGLNMWRYPQEYVSKPTKGLIWVPLFTLLPL